MIDQLPINEDDALYEAMNAIDPSGTLDPDTKEYDTIRCLIQGWIRHYGYGRALCMARVGRKRLGRWRKLL